MKKNNDTLLFVTSAALTLVFLVGAALVIILLTSCSGPPIEVTHEALSHGVFTPGPNLNVPRTNMAYASLQNGRLLLAGGLNDTGPLASAEIYHPPTHKFLPVGDMQVARARGQAVALPSGEIVILGGRNSDTYGVKLVEIFSPGLGTFSPAGNMVIGRSNFTATLLSNGKILSVGGYATVDSAGNPLPHTTDYILDSAEIYDPATHTSVSVSGMVHRRIFHASILMPNGNVLVTGGYNFTDNDLDSAEIYNSTTNTFSVTAIMTNARRTHTVSLYNGFPIVIGGTVGETENADEVASVNRFRVSTGKFTAMHSLCAVLTNFDGVTGCHGRGGHNSTTLANGSILVSGGYSSEIGWILPGEVFRAGDFTEKGSMIIGREYAATVLLPDGTVLIAGGDGDSVYSPETGALIESEVFHP